MEEQNVLLDGIKIIGNLSSDKWANFRLLRLNATLSCPEAIGVTYEDESVRDADAYKALLEKSSKGEGAWMAFAQISNGDLVAMAGARCPMGHLSTMWHVATIFSVYTFAEYRKQGIGTKLMETILAKLKATHITQVQAKVTATEKNAIGFYERLGFTRCGRFSNDICVGDELYDSILMEKSLED